MNPPVCLSSIFKLLLVFVISSTNAQLFQPNPIIGQAANQKATKSVYIDPSTASATSWDANNCYAQGYLLSPSSAICLLPPVQRTHFHTQPEYNPLLDALLLSASLGIRPKIPSFNHIDHLPLNPYLALLLSHYGKHTPVYGSGPGIYGYNAANNYHNNKPFGSYKIYEDV